MRLLARAFVVLSLALSFSAGCGDSQPAAVPAENPTPLPESGPQSMGLESEATPPKDSPFKLD